MHEHPTHIQFLNLTPQPVAGQTTPEGGSRQSRENLCYLNDLSLMSVMMVLDVLFVRDVRAIAFCN